MEIEKLDYTQADILAHELIKIAQSYIKTQTPEEVEKIIWETYIFAREAHGTQIRKSGEPYITHPLEASKILTILKPDLISIQACILHDVIEDTERTEDDIREKFGDDVAKICQGVSKLSTIRYQGEERSIESLRKMLLAMTDDLRVIIVKLADRLHNMRTLHFHPKPEKRERIALETLNIYAPIADRLGIFRFKEELETECFKILHPKEYKYITNELAKLEKEQDFFLSKTQEMIQNILGNNVGVKNISYRVKSPYSIFKKISRKSIEYNDVHDLYDLFAVRIITDNIRHCYEILGILHNAFIPMPKRFKDYIALPKENGYQSLHTTVVGLFPELRSQPTEIQIRTEAMHEHAEHGVAAHFTYSETGKSGMSKDSYWVETIKDILDDGKDGGEFMSDMSVNVFADQIFVFTPKGDIITLPRGATPVDFAYHIHSDIGNTIAVAKVNGKVVPLDYQLHNGESISIVRDKNNKPKPIWLSFVATSKAREYIRQYINREEREFFITKGRDILNAYLEKNYGKGLDKELSILKNVDGAVLDTKQKEDILVQIGNLSRKPSSVLKVISDHIISEVLGEKISETPEKKEKTEKKPENFSENSTEILIGKEKNIPHKIAQCCHPTPETKKIIGAIGQGTVTIHALDCPNVEKIALDRRIPAQWANQPPEKDKITIVMEVIFKDKRGILMRLTEHFYNFNINVLDFKIEPIGGGLVKDIFTLETENDDYYIFERLEQRLKFDIPEITEMNLLSLK